MCWPCYGWDWRGWGIPWYAPPPWYMPKEEEMKMLESEKTILEARLKEIDRRLKEVKGE